MLQPPKPFFRVRVVRRRDDLEVVANARAEINRSLTDLRVHASEDLEKRGLQSGELFLITGLPDLANNAVFERREKYDGEPEHDLGKFQYLFYIANQ